MKKSLSSSSRGYLSLIFLFFLIGPASIINYSGFSNYSLKDSLNSTFSISRSGTPSKALKFNFTWGDKYTSSKVVNNGRLAVDVNINFSLKKEVDQRRIKIYKMKVKSTFAGAGISGSVNIDYSLSCIGQISKIELRRKIRNKIQDHIIKKIIK